MKKIQNKFKGIAIVLAIFLLPVGAFTAGYFYKNNILEGKDASKTLTVDGNIGGTITGDIGESVVPGDIINKTVEINPKCTTSSLIRVKIEAYWEGTNPKDTSNLELIFNDSNKPSTDITEANGKWYKHDDGYLYYIGIVSQEIKSFKLVDGVRFDCTNSGECQINSECEKDINKYQNETIKIDVNFDVVQSRDGAFESAWNITGEENKKLKDKLSSLCQNN